MKSTQIFKIIIIVIIVVISIIIGTYTSNLVISLSIIWMKLVTFFEIRFRLCVLLCVVVVGFAPSN